MAVNCATAFAAACTATILRAVLVRLNTRLDRGEFVEGAINSRGALVPGEGAANGFRFKV